MKSLDELQHAVSAIFSTLIVPDQPAGLFDPIRYTMDLGGKRLRPLMVILACDTYCDRLEPAEKAAIGIELFHNFTLIHDDIMDNAPLRRGKETVYKKWDANTAILSGDAMFALSMEYIARIASPHLAEIMQLFAQTAREVCEGQQFDMDFETLPEVSLCEYMEMIRLKTAVLLACSFKTGALTGGANPEEAERLYEIGIQLGMSFQIMDDYLDLYGDESSFGKKTGGDIRARKKTYLFLKALEVADKLQRSELQELYSQTDTDETGLRKRIEEIYLDLRIREIAQDEMERYFRKAIEGINQLVLPEEKKLRLSTFAHRVLNRTH